MPLGGPGGSAPWPYLTNALPRQPVTPMSSTTFPALASGRRRSNLWDAAAFLCVFGALVAVGHVARGTLAPLAAPGAVSVRLDPAYLPGYAVRTTLRMFAALFASLVFTFTYATAAAKSRAGGDDPDPDARHPAIGADPRLPDLHRRLLHESVSRPRAGAGARGDFRDLHQPGLEHGVQLLPVADAPCRPISPRPPTVSA